MTVKFYGEEFDKYERFYAKPYIGYLSPDGKLVDYNTDLGGSHSNLANIVSWTFLLWVKNSAAFSDLGIRDIKMDASINMETGAIKNASVPIREFNESSNLLLLQRDLIDFLNIAESNEDFIKMVRREIDPNAFPDYIKKNKKLPFDTGESAYEIERLLGRDNTKSLLLLLKDICIEYLGYDAIERVRPDGQLITFPTYFCIYPDDFMTYLDKPRTITTTYSNINERFYNYLLMDYKIQQLPRYVYDSYSKHFEVERTFQSERDLICEEEISSIKKLVPKKDRVKFFR